VLASKQLRLRLHFERSQTIVRIRLPMDKHMRHGKCRQTVPQLKKRRRKKRWKNHQSSINCFLRNGQLGNIVPSLFPAPQVEKQCPYCLCIRKLSNSIAMPTVCTPSPNAYLVFDKLSEQRLSSACLGDDGITDAHTDAQSHPSPLIESSLAGGSGGRQIRSGRIRIETEGN
jgi:hypothetical protein